MRRGVRVLLCLLVLPVNVLIEAAFSGTALVTPIGDNFINIMRGVGFIFGLAFSFAMWKSPYDDPDVVGKYLGILAMPFVLAWAGGLTAWRVADWAEFGLSSQPFTAAPYDITRISYAKRAKRDGVSIDPFGLGDSTFIPVPSSQYEALLSAPDYGCIIVMQRQNKNGAVEIKTDGEFTWSEPEPAKLVPCPQT